MGTAEIIIVFSALMALIALVTIGIDWIGKPLKHRRFIPRMYRFEDEKLPIDAYGHTDFGGPQAPSMMPPTMSPPLQPPPLQPPPVVVAQVPNLATAQGAPDTVAVPAAAASQSAFSDSLAASTSGSTPAVASGPTNQTALRQSTQNSADGSAWTPGMALDATVDDRKPNLSTKAQRFWISAASGFDDSHFDTDNLARMQAGKAPSRRNHRTGRNETMQLSNLRQATHPDQVQMSWPDDSIDPWSTS